MHRSAPVSSTSAIQARPLLFELCMYCDGRAFDVRRALRTVTDDDRGTPDWAAAACPTDTGCEAAWLVRRLPAFFDILEPLSYFVAFAVKKTNTKAEARAATGGALLEFLRPREAAAILRLSVRTLDDYRITGGGPAYFVFGTLDRFRENGGGPPYLRLGNRIVYAARRPPGVAWSKRESQVPKRR